MANKQARVLHTQVIGDKEYKCNQVIEADAKLIKQLVAQGNLDDNAVAVKYCIANEKAQPILHESPQDEGIQTA